MKQAIGLENTKLWKFYLKKVSNDNERICWLKRVYEAAVIYLNDVRQEFKNYTMHDGTHVWNVLEAMGGLLGDYIDRLTIGELELLILVACLHDLGMVYTEEEKADYLADKMRYKMFMKEHYPEWLECEPKEWPSDIQQWYLRMLHPFRVSEVLQNQVWKELFEQRTKETAPLRCILAVCQAHGESPEALRGDSNLEYLPASDIDPLFCALLLRLADLLDFDDTRAPKILYGYVSENERSHEEWEKHQASAGFRYPASPVTEELPYKARCKNPTIEHIVRDFLDWIDEELDHCAKLQRYCKAQWQQEFPFPRAVSRREIESEGYMSGDFCISIDQEQILKLLMGENLYDHRDVFVRELLQNAIDATLLRDEMESSFVLDRARIDFWEWTDRVGNLWFGIDDQGTGMTLGILQRYFLKIGNSYYTSQELKRDLRDHGQTREFHGISRFGIGFLSCFLCADIAEVSTLYFDSQKNCREESDRQYSQMTRHGIRLQVTGLKGYYMLKSQAEGHQADHVFPRPEFGGDKNRRELERRGYRVKPGTSIALRLDPGKLGALNLRRTVESYLCAARMPVYYNGERIGRTYDEAMKMASELEGERVYELSAEMKKKFDDCFPAITGNYPKLMQKVVIVDGEKEGFLPGLSAVLIKNKVYFERGAVWKGKDQYYGISESVYYKENKVLVRLFSRHTGERSIKRDESYYLNDVNWYRLKQKYGLKNTEALKEKMDLFATCPETAEQLGAVWAPFSEKENLSEVWMAYVDHYHERKMYFSIEEYGGASLNSIFEIEKIKRTAYVYQGIIAGSIIHDFMCDDTCYFAFLMEKECKPIVEVSRSQVTDFPLNVGMAIAGILDDNDILHYIYEVEIYRLVDGRNITLKSWREMRNSPVGQWLMKNNEKYVQKIKYFDVKYDTEPDENNYHQDTYNFLESYIMVQYAMAYLQDHYSMTINYDKGQIIMFEEKAEEDFEDVYDMFPPMMFCKAANDQSRKYICSSKVQHRRGITVDHPFIVWLLEHSHLLKKYFRRQFRQIIDCLYEESAEEIVQKYHDIREQIGSLSGKYGLDAKAIPCLTLEDFWKDEAALE